MKQSAVEWLEEQIKDIFYVAEASEMIKQFKSVYEQAKEMEKQQIIDSFNEGWLQCNIYGLPEKSRKHFETSEQYYNETFKNK